jgi:predicted GNAT family acetyltransferase
MNIELEETAAQGRYFIPADNAADGVAELNFSKLDAHTISADRTYVPDRYRGQGIAAKLVERLVADARSKGVKIVPACSYVATAFERHPEWADVRQ